MPNTVSIETARAVKEKVLPKSLDKSRLLQDSFIGAQKTKESGIPEVRFQFVKLIKNV